jgi:hypothetical protein
MASTRSRVARASSNDPSLTRAKKNSRYTCPLVWPYNAIVTAVSGAAIHTGRVRVKNVLAETPAKKNNTLSSTSATAADTQSMESTRQALNRKAAASLATGFTP